MAAEAPALPTDNAGPVYLSLIEQQLESEQRRKDSLEQRGLALVTISTFLSGLLFALVAWANSSVGTNVPVGATGIALAAVVAFLVGAGFGVATLLTRDYFEAKPSELERLLETQYMEAPAEIATKRTGELLVKILKSARVQNNTKAKFIQFGIGFEGGAVALLGLSVALALIL